VGLLGLGVGLGVAGVFMLQRRGQFRRDEEEARVLGVVLEFLKAQSDRDLEKMCSMVTDDIVYINEPHPPERAIRGRAMFREAFAASPCIWCPEAKLQTLHYSRGKGNVVFMERLDQFKIDGVWLKIPILGFMKVRDGKIEFWKDYWDYAKYKRFVSEHFGENFHLFRKTLVSHN